MTNIYPYADCGFGSSALLAIGGPTAESRGRRSCGSV